MTRANHVFLVGPLPPPVHGMALVTAAVRDRLSTFGAKVTAVNLAANSLNRAIYARIARISKVLSGLATFAYGATRHPKAALYLAVSGGGGQVYDLLFVILARLFGMRLYLHHHNIVYMTKHRSLTQLLTRVAGSDATHIVASDNIGRILQDLYWPVSRTYPLSAVIVAQPAPDTASRDRSGIRTIGFIGNISEDKGIFDFLELVELLGNQGCKLSALVAGPFQKVAVEADVRSRLKSLPAVRYIGPTYGQEKVIFFDSIDVLICPVRNEYEGIVIHEAMSFGVPVIARDSGCIAEIVDSRVGYLVGATVSFRDKAFAGISSWLAAPEILRGASRASRRRFGESRDENIKRLDALCFEMMGRSFERDDIRAFGQ
jgi:glycosyltransferase involved in cell wall biosynthesis